MHARVWQLHIRPGKLHDFHSILSSLVALARQQEGYRGVLALASGKSEAPEVTLVALWDSLPAMRASENTAHHGTGTSRERLHCQQRSRRGVSLFFSMLIKCPKSNVLASA